MSHTLAIAWTVAAAAALGGPTLAWRSYSGAHARAGVESRRLVALRDKGEEIASLRAASTHPRTRAAEEGSLTPRVAAALSSSGLPASCIASLTPQTQTVVGSAGHRVTKRSAAVTLTPIKLPELGSFLQAWCNREPAWIVSSIELAPDTTAASSPGADLPLRVNLTIESLAADDAGGTP